MIYTFRNKQTDEITEVKMPLSDLDQYMADHPDLERYHSIETFPGFGDSMRMNVPGAGQPCADFEHGVIERIKQTVPGNRLGQTHKTKLPREW